MGEEKTKGGKGEEHTACSMHGIVKLRLKWFNLPPDEGDETEEKEKTERKSVGTFGKVLVAIAVLALVSIFVCIVGYENIGTAMVRVAIVVVAGAFYTLWLWRQN